MTTHPLLEIQSLDTEAEQLRHRRDHLEARSTLEALRSEIEGIEARIEELGVQRVEVATRQKRFEDEAAAVEAKADADDARLYGGEVGVKDLQALQDEVASLRARQGELEDRALEAMEEAEALTEQVAAAEAELADADARVTVAVAELRAGEEEIDAALATVAQRRADAVAALHPDDLARYERLRPGMGVATVVRFDGSNCVGCPSTMPAVELDRVKHEPPGSVLTCSECGRIVLT